MPGPNLALAETLPWHAGPRECNHLVRVPEWRPAMAIDAGAPAQMWAGVALKQ